MTKAPSKTEALRALREARHTEQGRPAPEVKKPARTELQREIDAMVSPKVPTPDLKPAKPAKNVATKNKKRVAEVIGKAREGIRLDRRQLNIWVDKDLAARVKILAAQQETTIEEWVTTAIEMRLGIK
jgi:hypothetical protein